MARGLTGLLSLFAAAALLAACQVAPEARTEVEKPSAARAAPAVSAPAPAPVPAPLRPQRPAASGTAVVPALPPPPATVPAAPPRTVRTATWVVRDQLASPESIRKLCSGIRAAGADRVLFQVRGRGDAYYASDLAPRAENATAADPLAEALEACRGVEPVAWMNAFLVWSGDAPPKAAEHVARRNPEWMIRDADGRPVAGYDAEERARGWIEGIYADPASREYRAHFAAVAAEVARKYPVAGIHLDFVRYPGPGYGQGGLLGVTYRSRYGFDPRLLPYAFGTVDTGKWLRGEEPLVDRVLTSAKLLWAELRAEEVTALVREVRRAVKAVRPDVELSAAIFPDAPAAFLEKGQDWRGWAAEGLVDALFPMAYFGMRERVSAQLGETAGAVRGEGRNVALWAGLGAYIKSPEEIAGEAFDARSLGYDGVSLYEAGNLLAKPEGLAAYIALARGERAEIAPSAAGKRKAADATRSSDPAAEQSLAQALSHALRCAAPEGERFAGDGEKALAARNQEFQLATAEAVPLALERLARDGVDAPPWVELHGIFRYVHPADPPERGAEQAEIAEKARRRLLSGENFAKVAAELSQGGTRSCGGGLGKRYLRKGNPEDDAVLPLAAGQVSPVVEVSNGYWVYRVDARGPAEKVKLEKADWSALRPAFREALRRALAEKVEPILAKEGRARGGGG